jgi:signal peptidase I
VARRRRRSDKVTSPDASPAEPPRRWSAWALGWAKSIALAVAIWYPLQALVVKSFRINSGSMEPTLLVNDFLIVNRAVFGARIPLVGGRTPTLREPRRDELIVLRGIEEPVLTIVKRVIGTAGDTLAMRNDSLFRNGAFVPAPAPYRRDPTAVMDSLQRVAITRWQRPLLVADAVTEPYLPDLHDWGPFVIPAGHLFVMGDNRDASYDGRHWGVLPRGNVIGRPFAIYFSFDPTSWRPLPFITAIRWNRLFRSPW